MFGPPAGSVLKPSTESKLTPVGRTKLASTFSLAPSLPSESRSENARTRAGLSGAADGTICTIPRDDVLIASMRASRIATVISWTIPRILD